MRKTNVAAPLCAALLAALALLPSPAGAQAFYSEEIGRGLGVGVYPPYYGASVTQRYNLQTGSFLYFNGNARQLWYLDYLDRLDRAERFGYRPPPDPFPPRVVHPYAPPPCDPPPVYRYER